MNQIGVIWTILLARLQDFSLVDHFAKGLISILASIYQPIFMIDILKYCLFSMVMDSQVPRRLLK